MGDRRGLCRLSRVCSDGAGSDSILQGVRTRDRVCIGGFVSNGGWGALDGGTSCIAYLVARGRLSPSS
jgi:hypothetical protein